MSDIFRKEYQTMDDETKEVILMIKQEADKLYQMIENTDGDPRMKALAKTNLEQSIMWAVKSITK